MSLDGYLAILLAAGSGQRFKSPDRRPKWATEIAGLPLLSYVLRGLKHTGFRRILVLTRSDEIDWATNCASSAGILVETAVATGVNQVGTALEGLRIAERAHLGAVLFSADMLSDPEELSGFMKRVVETSLAEIHCLCAYQDRTTSGSWNPVAAKSGRLKYIEHSSGHFERLALVVPPNLLPRLLTLSDKVPLDHIQDLHAKLGTTVNALIQLTIEADIPVLVTKSNSLAANVNTLEDVSVAREVIDQYFDRLK